MSPDIVITGLGAQTHFGSGVEALLQAVEQAVPVSVSSAFESHHTQPHEFRHLSRSAAAFAAAAEEAWRDANLPEVAPESDRVALIEGSSLGPLPDAIDAIRSGARARPTDLLRFMPGSGGAHFAQQHGIRGSVSSVSAASVSGALAIVNAAQLIRSGIADVVVAGAVDRPVQVDIVQRFESAGILSCNGCRPYALDRSGTVLADAAGAVVLENSEHAAQRSARVYGQLLAAEVATEASAGATPNPTGDGVAHAVRKVMAALGGMTVGWIKGHGTGTPKGDAAECAGLHRALGIAFPTIPITSLKATLGHSLGASGMVECIAALLAARAGFIPTTAGTRVADRALAINLVTSARPVGSDGIVVMLSQSFGGRCAALAWSGAMVQQDGLRGAARNCSSRLTTS